MVRTRARSGALAAALAAVAVTACDGPADVTGRLLELAPAEAEVVVAIAPAQVTGTWLDCTDLGLARDPAAVAAERAAPAR